MIAFRTRTTGVCLATVLVLAAHDACALEDAAAAPVAGSKPPSAAKADVAAPNVAAPDTAAPDAAAPSVTAPDAAASSVAVTNADAAARPIVQTLGEADQKIFVVDHEGKWSMHAENVLTSNIVRLWQQAGGPEVTMKEPVDRPFTLSVHAVAPEAIFERLFEGYGYTLHYDDDGALVAARIYSMAGANTFKTPRLTQTLGDWKKAETGPETAAAPAE
jgi:hypothetical protein